MALVCCLLWYEVMCWSESKVEHPGNGGNRLLQNTGTYLLYHMAITSQKIGTNILENLFPGWSTKMHTNISQKTHNKTYAMRNSNLQKFYNSS
jgi:hypothetical protein